MARPRHNATICARFAISFSGRELYLLRMQETRSASDRLATRIMWGLAAGLALGLLARGLLAWQPSWTDEFRWFADKVLDPIGQVFLRTLFFVVVPLVFSSLALGVVQLGKLNKLGPLAGRTFLLFVVNMSVGVALGLAMMSILNPGSRIDDQTRAAMLAEYGGAAQTIQGRAQEQPSIDPMFLVEMFMPRNVVKAVVEFQILPLIVFALLFGAAGTMLSQDQWRKLKDGLEIVTELMIQIVNFALLLAPIAVPAMIMSVIVKFGFSFLASLLLFVAGVLAIMALHLFGTMSVLLKLLSRRSPIAFFRAVRTVMVTAFSTSSSSATLPTSIQTCREKLGVSPSTSGFVLPLGATMNMSGTALYEGCVVLFIAQVYGVQLGLGQQLTLLLLAVLSAVAVAGIPGASLPLIVGLLVTFNIPPEGIALILGTDRILDMARTTVNVTADVVTACIVDDRLGAEPETS